MKNNVSRSNLDNECITSLCMWIVIESVDQKPEPFAHLAQKNQQKWPKNHEIPCILKWRFPKTDIQTTKHITNTMYEPISIYVFFLLYLVAFLNIMYYAKVCAFYSEVLEHKHSSNSNIAASMYIKN